jgi:ADP-ribose pyrophosphatase
MKKRTPRKAATRKQPKQPKILSSKVTYRGPVFYVTSEQVLEPTGVKVRRDVVRHTGSAVILPVDDAKSELRVLLARQYRYAAGQWLWELPAGRIDPGEDALTAAKRELQEETGYTARSWRRALFFWVSPGFLDETMTLYLALGLKRGSAKPEEDEVIAKRLFPLSAAVRLVMRDAIKDA